MREAIEEAFWNFVDQKWRDALNVVAAELPAWGSGGGGRTGPQDGARREASKLAKASTAAMNVTGVDGKRHRQGDSGRSCVFKGVMGCTAAHPPWLCKVFGNLPAGERERLIKDKRLCPFCLLHDKDKPCGAKQKPVACTASECKERHIQKLHDVLKDVFQERSQVHVVHGDDGWEESEEAWELGEEEMMIVGTVQQEGDCSWQDACESWIEQGEETAAEAYHVGTCQGAAKAEDNVADMTGSKAVKQETVSQCKKAGTTGADKEASEPDDLLLDGEEQEYFLKLLMRKVSPEQPRTGQPARDEDNPKAKTAPAKGRGKKRSNKKEKKALKKSQARVERAQEREVEVTGQASSLERQEIPDLLDNPEAKGRGLVDGNQEKKNRGARPHATSGEEWSGQKTPDSS
jgi:hypothetical protein